ncbi:hypothetical protein ACH5RR_033888 [Cinchona calisaya]|uniref:Uncharacterized protein n=1 Tax=Cinchona calisaya TaxID=153742 RepID=A0ABD2YDW0_9GENT
MADKLYEVLSKFALCSEKKEGTSIEPEDMREGVSECHKSLISMVNGEKAVNFTAIGAKEMAKRIEDDREMFKKAFSMGSGGEPTLTLGYQISGKESGIYFHRCQRRGGISDRGQRSDNENLQYGSWLRMSSGRNSPTKKGRINQKEESSDDEREGGNHRKGIDKARLAASGIDSQLSSLYGGVGNLLYTLWEGSSELNKTNMIEERRHSQASGQLEVQNVSLEVVSNLPTAMDEDNTGLYGKENIHVDNLIETLVQVEMDKGISKDRKELLKRYKKGKGVIQRKIGRNPFIDVSNSLKSEFDLGKRKVSLIAEEGEVFERCLQEEKRLKEVFKAWALKECKEGRVEVDEAEAMKLAMIKEGWGNLIICIKSSRLIKKFKKFDRNNVLIGNISEDLFNLSGLFAKYSLVLVTEDYNTLSNKIATIGWTSVQELV